ncbi:MAG TPA: hypothetical protein VF263_01175 [Longimicrobiaceae bacterium]
MKAVRATLGILTLCALSACGEATAPLSPEQAAPRHNGGILTIGAGAVEPPANTTAADTTSRLGGFWTIGVGD